MKKKKTRDLDFQISFYESILKNNPDYIDVLMALGEVYTKKGFYQKGLDIDRRLVYLKPENPIAHYNLACSLSLSGEIAGAFSSLKDAIKLGYDDFLFLSNDPDLANLRRDERFAEFAKMMKTKKDSADATSAR